METIYEKRAKLGGDLQGLIKSLETKNDQEAQNSYDALTKEYDDLCDLISAQEKRAAKNKEIESTLAQPVGQTFSYAGTNQGQPKKPENTNGNDEKAFQMAAFRSVLTGRRTVDQYERELEQRGLRVDVPSSGGYLVPPQEFSTMLIQGVKDLLFFRNMASVNPPLAKAESIGFPTRTGDYGSLTWTSELSTPTEDTGLSFGKREMIPHKLAKLVKISRELIQRSALPAESIVMDRISYQVARTQENAYLNGTGDKQPLGVFTASADGINTDRDVVAGASNLPTIDGFIDAAASLKSQYQPNLVCLTHRLVVAALRKQKASTAGSYLWQPAVAAGDPERLANVPIIKSELAPSATTAGAYFAVMGDFKAGYMIQDALDVQMQVLFELYAATREIGYIVELWSDGAPVLSEAFARLKGA